MQILIMGQPYLNKSALKRMIAQSYLIAILLIVFVIDLQCQNDNLVRPGNRFVCPSDSIMFYFNKNYIEYNEIDTLLALHYLYDNGREEDEVQTLLWKEDGVIKIKIVCGCDQIQEFTVIH